MPGWLRTDEAIAPEEQAMQAQGTYHHDDPTIEQAAAAYAQGRLQAQYFEARYQAEQRALRGHLAAAMWTFPLYMACWLPGFLCCAVALAHAREEYRLSGVRCPEYWFLIIEVWLISPLVLWFWWWMLTRDFVPS